MFDKWVAMWGNAISIAERKPADYSKNITLRYPVYAPFNGEALRFTFSNYCGTEPITISKAIIADTDFDDDKITNSDSKIPNNNLCIPNNNLSISNNNLSISNNNLSIPNNSLHIPNNGSKNINMKLNNKIKTNTATIITFNGNESVTIAPGCEVVSDSISYNVKRGNGLSVSFYLKDFTQMRSAVLVTGPLSKGYFAIGNHTESAELPVDYSRSTSWFYFLSTIEVLTEQHNHAVICYGDSITAQDWPDYLTLRLIDEGIDDTSIIRRAVCGTRILRQYSCITYESYGLKGANRFAREVNTNGADVVIIQHGINDIIHPVGTDVNIFRPWSDLPTKDELIEGLRIYIEEARKHKLKVYLGTLLPIEGWRTYEPFREKLKNDVNDWIRSCNEADGVIDFDKALRDVESIASFAPGFDSGDHLHPSTAAYKKMAECIDVSFLNNTSFFR